MSNHSEFWIDENLFNDSEDEFFTGGVEERESRSKLRHLIRLAAVRRSTANFVSIVSGQNLPVKFSSGKDSYTDGNTVVIAGDDNPKNFDAIVGLALHEGSHILLSDFDFLQNYARKIQSSQNINGYNNNRNILPEFIRNGLNNVYDEGRFYENPGYGLTMKRMLTDIKHIMNIMEDRRIDQYVYRRAPGYRPYYDAMYRKYFYTPTVAKNLKYDPLWREVCVESYMDRLLLAFHPDNDFDALPGFREIIKIMDVENIDRVSPDNDDYVDFNGERIPAWKKEWTFDNTPVLYREAAKVYDAIIRQVGIRFEKLYRSITVPNSVKDLVNDPSARAAAKADDTGLDNLDMGSDLGPSPESENSEEEKDGPPVGSDVETTTTGKKGKYNPDSGRRQIDKMIDVMDGNAPKKRVSKSNAKTLDIIDKGDVDLVLVGGDGISRTEVVVTRGNTPDFLSSDAYPFNAIGYAGEWRASGRFNKNDLENAIAAGRRMGTILTSRLQIREDDVTSKYSRLSSGKIDKRLLATLGAGAENIFHRVQVDSYKPAMLHLSIDASGSMSGPKWGKVITVATALAYVSKKIRNVDVTISFRGAIKDIVNSFVFDSRKHTFGSWLRVARISGPNGGTPESLCFEAVLKDMLVDKDTHSVYFINFSDGAPGCAVRGDNYYSGYYGERAVTHCRKQVKIIKDSGINVLSYFITQRTDFNGSMRQFRSMYGQDAEHVNVENATQVLKTLNKLLAVR